MMPITHSDSNKYGDVPLIFSDTVFSFWEDVHVQPNNSSNSLHDDDDDESETTLCSLQNNKAFWEQQYQLLQASMCRSSSIEKRVGQATKEVLRELKDMQCLCHPTMLNIKSCRNCLRREICDRLFNLGYNSAICVSKWTASSEIKLSGEHTYLEVIMENSKRGEVKVVIELNFRAEFEMARANEEYKRLIRGLPEVFVGKAERLRVLIKIMCAAAKKCMKEKKMHLGPWRKHKYMEAKWLGMTAPLPTVYTTTPSQKPKASMLTHDLLQNIPTLHCAVRC